MFSKEIKLYESGVMLLDLLTQHNDCSHMKIVIMEVWYYCTKYADSTHNSFHEKKKSNIIGSSRYYKYSSIIIQQNDVIVKGFEKTMV